MISSLKKEIALQLAYQRRLGQLDASDVDREEKAREWAELHYRDDTYNFIDEASKITKLN